MKNNKVKVCIVVLPAGDEIDGYLPIEATGNQIVNKLLSTDELKIPVKDNNGNKILYDLLHKESSTNIENMKLKDCEVKDDDHLFLSPITLGSGNGSQKMYDRIISAIDIRFKEYIDKSNDVKNHIIVQPLFSNRSFEEKKSTCFIIMPFSLKWSKRVHNKIVEIANSFGWQCLRADDLYGHDILEDIWTAIKECELIIADITSKNPNVFYEIGIAHTLGKKTILLSQNAEDIPFDFKRFRHIIYEDNVDGFTKLDKELSKYFPSVRQRL